MKNKTVLLLLLILMASNTFAQKDQLKYSNTCSKLIVQVGQKWRLDSLGKKNIRKGLVQNFIKSKIDKVTNTQVWENLGAPSEIWKESDKVSYIYYFFYGKRYKSRYYAEYLIFTFNIDNSLLISISQEESDRG